MSFASTDRRIAIVGLGHVGRFHVAALTRAGGLRLVAGSDRDAGMATMLPEGLPFYPDHSTLLAAGGFDAVVVATPNSSHNAIARDVLTAGFDVIVEKPAARDASGIDAIETAARQAGRKVYFAFHAAMAYEVLWLRCHMAQNPARYGPLTGFSSRFFDKYIDAEQKLVRHALSLDDCWSDSGVNALSVLDGFIGTDLLRPTATRQSGLMTRPPGVLSFSVHFRFPVQGDDLSGSGVIETGWDQGISSKVTELAFATTGWRFVLDHSAQSVTAFAPSGGCEVLQRFEGDRLLNHYLSLFADFRDRCTSGDMNGQAASRIHKLLSSVELS